MVERKTVEHFTHIEANLALRASQSLSYLPEHGFVIDVDFNERGVFTINKRQIAICAVVWTAV